MTSFHKKLSAEHLSPPALEGCPWKDIEGYQTCEANVKLWPFQACQGQPTLCETLSICFWVQPRGSWGRGATLLKICPLCVQRTVSVQSQHLTPPAAQEPLTWSQQRHGLQVLISEMEAELVIKFFRNLKLFALQEVPSDSRGSMRWSARCCPAAAEKCQHCLKQAGSRIHGFWSLWEVIRVFWVFLPIGQRKLKIHPFLCQCSNSRWIQIVFERLCYSF